MQKRRRHRQRRRAAQKKPSNDLICANIKLDLNSYLKKDSKPTRGLLESKRLTFALQSDLFREQPKKRASKKPSKQKKTNKTGEEEVSFRPFDRIIRKNIAKNLKSNVFKTDLTGRILREEMDEKIRSRWTKWTDKNLPDQDCQVVLSRSVSRVKGNDHKRSSMTDQRRKHPNSQFRFDREFQLLQSEKENSFSNQKRSRKTSDAKKYESQSKLFS